MEEAWYSLQEMGGISSKNSKKKKAEISKPFKLLMSFPFVEGKYLLAVENAILPMSN